MYTIPVKSRLKRLRNIYESANPSEGQRERESWIDKKRQKWRGNDAWVERLCWCNLEGIGGPGAVVRTLVSLCEKATLLDEWL